MVPSRFYSKYEQRKLGVTEMKLKCLLNTHFYKIYVDSSSLQHGPNCIEKTKIAWQKNDQMGKDV